MQKTTSFKHNIPKLTNFRAFFALLKAYVAISILLTPRAFVNGGYVMSPFALIFATLCESLCTYRMASVALDLEVYSYPLLMERAIGSKGLVLAHIFLAIAHWQFTVGQTTFALESLQSTLASWNADGQEKPLWVFGLGVIVVYSPIMWVRKLSYFSKGFIVACFCILCAVLTTSYYAIDQIKENDGETAPGYVAINRDLFWNTIGYGFYMFEGIGCLLPIMRETEHPENVGAITVAA